MPSVNSSLQELGSSVVSIFFGLLHSLLAVFYAILALGQDFINAFLNLSHAVLKAAVEISGGVVELLWTNFFVIVLFAGCYYLYTRKGPRRGLRRA